MAADRFNAQTEAMQRQLVRGALALVLYAIVLFGTAGSFAWPMGWVFLAVMAATMAYVLFGIRDDALLAERNRWHRDAKWWDKILMPLAVLPIVATLIVAGLDFRWGWSPVVPWWFRLAAVVPVAFGLAITLWALKVNTFFSSVVRIQTDRGHRVITDGPYRYIRHPGYSGLLIWMLALPVMLGSLWALLPALVSVLVILIRTPLEDRTLQRELAGYASYAEKTRYRLLPGLW